MAARCWQPAYPALALSPSDFGTHRLEPARRCKAAAKAMQRPAKTCKGVAKPPYKRLRNAQKPTQSGTQHVVSWPENSISAPPHTTKPPSLATPGPGGPAAGVAGVWGYRSGAACSASGPLPRQREGSGPRTPGTGTGRLVYLGSSTSRSGCSRTVSPCRAATARAKPALSPVL